MKTFNDAVKTLLQEQAFWYVATCDEDGTPHLITTLFKAVLPDGRLAIARNFMKTTVANAKRCGKVTVGVGKFPQPEATRSSATPTLPRRAPSWSNSRRLSRRRPAVKWSALAPSSSRRQRSSSTPPPR